MLLSWCCVLKGWWRPEIQPECQNRGVGERVQERPCPSLRYGCSSENTPRTLRGGVVLIMECFHWLRQRCLQLVTSEGARGWYSATASLPAKRHTESCGGGSSPGRLAGKRRTVIARGGPYQAEYHGVSKEYQGNAIRTTKYSMLSFIPMNLFQQFRRFLSFYTRLTGAQ